MRSILPLLFLSLAALGAAATTADAAGAPDGLIRAPSSLAPGPDERQGGEMISDAIGIWSLPFNDWGTTEGYRDDYDAVCPNGSHSPDVVYFVDNRDQRFEALDVDLCSSDYDTKVYVYRLAGMVLVACNDDATCNGQFSLQSRLENVPLESTIYYIIIDGSNDEAGGYNVLVDKPIGACCLPDGRCQPLTHDDCPGVWSYNGPDSPCDPNPCPEPEVYGACCFSNASCRILTQERCELLRGRFMGEGTACDPNPCAGLAGLGIRRAPGDPPAPEQGEPSVQDASWGKIKSRYR